MVNINDPEILPRPLLLSSDIYQEICDHARQAVGVGWVQFLGYDASTGWIRQLGTARFHNARLRRIAEASARVVPGFVAADVSPHITNNEFLYRLYHDGQVVDCRMREIAQGVVPWLLIRMAELSGLRWVFAHPMKIQGQVVGALTFHSSRPYSDRQRRIAHAFLELGTLTVENHRLLDERSQQVMLVKESRERMVDAEERVRKEVAERLHGSLQTRLLIVGHQLGELQSRISSEQQAQVRTIRDIIDDIRENDVRLLSHRLHPPVLAIGLLPAIRSLGAQMGTALTVEVSADAGWDQWDDPLDNSMSERYRLAIYRIAEEALNNAHRHGKASQVTIRLSSNEQGVELQVTDDGQGFNVQSAERGLGWWSIEGYVSDLGGEMIVQSRPGQGTILRALLPIPRADH